MKYLKTFEKKTNYSITLCFNDIYEILSKYYGDAFLRTPDTGSDDCEYRLSRKIMMEYFANKKIVTFEGDTSIIDMPFNKKRASDKRQPQRRESRYNTCA